MPYEKAKTPHQRFWTWGLDLGGGKSEVLRTPVLGRIRGRIHICGGLGVPKRASEPRSLVEVV